MKIGMITLHNVLNYGAVLQAYALANKLSDYGKVVFLNYENNSLKKDSKIIRFEPSMRGVLRAMKDVIRLKSRMKVVNKFKQFRLDNFVFTQKVTSSASSVVSQFDCLVAGSDQIWNPMCVNRSHEIDPVYFLRFEDYAGRKVSYASSTGGYRFTGEQVDFVVECLRGFSRLSVREAEAVDHLSTLIGADIEHVLDPTLLLNQEEWDKLIAESGDSTRILNGIPPQYVLLYSVPRVPLLAQLAHRLAREERLPTVTIDQEIFPLGSVAKHLNSCGPIDFLTLFKNASYVVTDSFHGVCFALIFRKKFAVVAPGVHSSRIESLLTSLGLDSRIVYSAEDVHSVPADCDFSHAYEKLDKKRVQSLKFLEAAMML